ncbi:MAG: carbamoylphosphate synthase large subunit, partial [Lachnospiraceae bacterium]|nr:carbamoylphosphate synthase large subunit [Lachnospiraceae bacterium]
SRYRANITMSDRMPAVLAQGMGDQMYIAKFSEKDQMEAFLQYVIA